MCPTHACMWHISQVVAKLEAEYATVNEEVKRCASETTASTNRLATLRSEVQRAKEALTMGEKSLGMAKVKAAESR